MSALRFDILTVFPEMFESPLSSGVVGRALKNQIIDVNCLDIRLFTEDHHKSVDDYPFGGGGGAVGGDVGGGGHRRNLRARAP